MLKAYLHRKLGRTWGQDAADASASSEVPRLPPEPAPRLSYEAIRHHEDSLTAMVLGRLFYLPIERLVPLLLREEDRVTGASPAPPADEPHAVRFWPRLPRADASSAREYVEPDLLVEFSSQRWIVEAKLHESQSTWQWRQELEAVQEEGHLATDPARAAASIWLLALGGERTDTPEQLRRDLEPLLSPADGPPGRVLGIHHLSWDTLATRIRALLGSTAARSSRLPPPQQRILEDSLLALADRGIRPRRYLSELSRVAPSRAHGSKVIVAACFPPTPTRPGTLLEAWRLPRAGFRELRTLPRASGRPLSHRSLHVWRFR